MDINQIKRVKNAMTAVDEESAQNMLLALLLDAYWQGKYGFIGYEETVRMFVEGTR